MENSFASDPACHTAHTVLPTAPTSPNEETVAALNPASIMAPGKHSGLHQQRLGFIHIAVPSYPTPPTSSSSSSTRKRSDEGSDGGNPKKENGATKSNRPSPAREQSRNIVMPLRTRRKTSGLNAVSNITTSASHISNPTPSQSDTMPNTPVKDTPATSALSSLTSHLENVRLTDGVAPLRMKNTPPLTPRALSNDGSDASKNTPPGTDLDHPKSNLNSTATTSAPRSSAPVQPPRGKLIVTVSGARGLKPSYAPYAVCAFEEIESYAHDTKQEEPDTDNEMRSRDHVLGGVPIKRSGSDMGRSIAIPMKSRQSSTTSLSDQQDFKSKRHTITEPRWDHEAVL